MLKLSMISNRHSKDANFVPAIRKIPLRGWNILIAYHIVCTNGSLYMHAQCTRYTCIIFEEIWSRTHCRHVTINRLPCTVDCVHICGKWDTSSSSIQHTRYPSHVVLNAFNGKYFLEKSNNETSTSSTTCLLKRNHEAEFQWDIKLLQ